MTYLNKFWLKSYDQDVSGEIDPPSDTVIDHLEKHRQATGGMAALYFLGLTLTHEDVLSQADRFACALQAAGYGKGDVVGICLPNVPQYSITILGAFKAGCTVSNVSPLLSPEEMVFQLDDCEAKVLVIADVLYPKFAGIADEAATVKLVLQAGIFDVLKFDPAAPMPTLTGKSLKLFMAFLNEQEARPLPRILTLDDVCFIQYTGGTTGMPKGASLTHRNLMSNMAQFAAVYPLERGKDIFCSGLPMFHIAGLVVSMLGFYFGMAQILIPDPRNVQHIIQESVKYKPTVMVNVPTLYLMLVREPEFRNVDWSGLKVCFSGAAPFSQEGINALEEVVGKGKLSELYGSTETSPLIAFDQKTARKRVGSVGLPVPSTLVKIVDLADGKTEVPVGNVGEIVVSGPQVMQGYHNKPEETAQVFHEDEGLRWLHVGDVGRMDEDGFLYLVDRTKDMIIVGGYKVFSTEVENVMHGHPAIEMCAVIGEKNPDRPETEQVKLMVQPKASYKDISEDKLREEILAYAREKLAPYKVPKVVQFIEMPLTAVGKINKKALR